MLSAQMINGLILTCIVLMCIVLIIVKYRGNLHSRHSTLRVEKKNEDATFETLIEYIKNALHELSHSQMADAGLHEEEYRRRIHQRAELRRALKDCANGSMGDKRFVKNLMAELLINGYGLNEKIVDIVMPFSRPELFSIQDQFEIIFYQYQQKFGADALSRLLDTYDLAEMRYSQQGEEDGSYLVTAEDIRYIYDCEYRPLSFLEKVDIIVQRIYQHYKGFSVIDDIRDQRIDGVSGGVSGMPEGGIPASSDWPSDGYVFEQTSAPTANGYESVWIFYKGKTIHLSFLSFGSERELKRVCQNIYKYNYPGQLSEANGYKVNEMKDGSRVVVVRPPFSESWAFFIRKFDIQSASLEQLIKGQNADFPIQLLSYLMKGSRITAITGAQGSGKTTLLMAMVKHIYASYTLRVQEMAFELHLRSIYSRRNILTFRETDHISGQQGLDLQKKTDGTVNILGEVASDEVAAWMIQMSQVASLFTIFTHHAKTFRDLVFSLRNSLLKTGVFQHEGIAEEQVVHVINFDVHLKRDAEGRRYIERITECVPRDPDHTDAGSNVSTSYSYRHIMEYRNGSYIPMEPLTAKSAKEMCEQMNVKDARDFRSFLTRYWEEDYES
ncbi:ATPase, T2SS/T4P/T4SS family [Paenibacillus sp. FSL M7-0802]|jgi:pilus assembly protein CpaF|uniref:ATPase, T2SS/T4P/T4SS family n=1 Tax=Paenibacillus TaxID=44249 RepID=UPI0006A741A7|nr:MULTISPECIES: ATPase, T2SS/T4P/T4SS family [Paenibacillus]ALA42569.1 pilus assembly protein CpaF [Paenibacillus peoriae]OMF71971.1 pilus assembly protein CpaF [Paenibacillus peoriae]